MAVNFSKVFGNAFRYSFSFQRILPFFVLNLIIVGILLLLLNNLATIIPNLTGVAGIIAPSVNSILYFYLYFMVFIIVFFLIKLFFVGVIIDDAKKYPKKKKLSSSFGIVKKKYMSILGASLLVAVIAGLAGSIPILGAFLSIIVSWLFLFIVPFIILKNKSAIDSLKESYNLIMKNKADVFLFWLLLLVLGVLIFLVSLIPLAISSFSILVPLYQVYLEGTINMTAILTIVQQNLGYLTVGAVISSIGLAYMSVFQESAKTFFFLQKKKR